MKRMSFVCTILFGMLFLNGCVDFQAAIGDEFSLRKDETVKIKGEPLTITLLGIGREWTEEAEYAFADMLIELKGEEKSISVYVGEQWTVGDYVIALMRADPFGDTGCKLVVETTK